MGCGTSLKVTAISQPTSKKEVEEEVRAFKITRFKFKLPTEVLQGFGVVLKLVTRKPEKRRREKDKERSEIPGEQLLTSHHTNHSDTNTHNPRFSLPEASSELKEELVSLRPQTIQPCESAYSKNTSYVEDGEEGKERGAGRIETMEMKAEGRQSMFVRVEEGVSDSGLHVQRPKTSDWNESDLQSPEAPHVLSDEEEEGGAADLSMQRQLREERDRQAAEAANLIASTQRQHAEASLEAQKTALTRMEDAAQSILSKYK